MFPLTATSYIRQPLLQTYQKTIRQALSNASLRVQPQKSQPIKADHKLTAINSRVLATQSTCLSSIRHQLVNTSASAQSSKMNRCLNKKQDIVVTNDDIKSTINHCLNLVYDSAESIIGRAVAYQERYSKNILAKFAMETAFDAITSLPERANPHNTNMKMLEKAQTKLVEAAQYMSTLEMRDTVKLK